MFVYLDGNHDRSGVETIPADTRWPVQLSVPAILFTIAYALRSDSKGGALRQPRITSPSCVFLAEFIRYAQVELFRIIPAALSLASCTFSHPERSGPRYAPRRIEP